MTTRSFVHLNTRIDLRCSAAAAAHLSFVWRFFRHSMLETPADGQPTNFEVVVEEYNRDLAAELAAAGGERVTIRRSTAEPFNFDALRCRREDGWWFSNQHTLLHAPPVVSGRGERLRLWVSAGSTTQVLDLVRDLTIRHEENRGTVILHAAAARTATGVVAISGRKGAGKTTSLFNLLHHEPYRYFAGDKLFLELRSEQLYVHPWRDWPHVGLGTLRQFPALAAAVEAHLDQSLSGRPDGDKVLLDPDWFEERFAGRYAQMPGRLEALVLPRVDPTSPLVQRPLTEARERWARFQQLLDRSCDTDFFVWQTFLVPEYSQVYASLLSMRHAIERLPCVELRGRVDQPIRLPAGLD